MTVFSKSVKLPYPDRKLIFKAVGQKKSRRN